MMISTVKDITYFKREKWKTMSVIDLVTRCTTESCHTSIRFSIGEEQHYDNTQFSQRLWTELCGA